MALAVLAPIWPESCPALGTVPPPRLPAAAAAWSGSLPRAVLALDPEGALLIAERSSPALCPYPMPVKAEAVPCAYLVWPARPSPPAPTEAMLPALSRPPFTHPSPSFVAPMAPRLRAPAPAAVPTAAPAVGWPVACPKALAIGGTGPNTPAAFL